MFNPIRRRKYFVDSRIQGALIRRIMHYWLLSLFIVGGLTFVGWVFVSPGIGHFVGPEAFMARALPVFVTAIVVTAILAPIAVIDLIRMSNRVVGPMVRLRRAMRALAAGEVVKPIEFRTGDYFQEFSDQFNLLLMRTSAMEAAARGDSATESTTAEDDKATQVADKTSLA
jgi:methyl-accepting chemotaxis protein